MPVCFVEISCNQIGREALSRPHPYCGGRKKQFVLKVPMLPWMAPPSCASDSAHWTWCVMRIRVKREGNHYGRNIEAK